MCFRFVFLSLSQVNHHQGQDLACTPETVEGSQFIEAVLPLHWRSVMQYIATVSMPGRKSNHGVTMVSTSIASRWSRPVSDTFVSMPAPYACFQLGPPWLNLRDTL